MSADHRKQWPHKEMLVVGKTAQGHRIARKDDGSEIVLAPGQPAVEYFYNGPTMREFNGGK